MMDRLRSPLQTLGVTAFLMSALLLAGLGTSHARPSYSPESVNVGDEPCNDVCKAYMAWSDRVSAMFRPSRPPEQNAADHGRSPRPMVHHASKTRQPDLNSFAQFPVPRDSTPEPAETPQAAEPPQAEVAPSEPTGQIADFLAAGKFTTARRAGTDTATNDAADHRTVVAVADTIPAARATGTVDASTIGRDMRSAAALLLALCTLPALVFWRRSRGRRAATAIRC